MELEMAMSKPIVYFAHPIDLMGKGGPRRVYETAVRNLEIDAGIQIYDPAKAFIGNMADGWAKWAANQDVLKKSAMVLAWLPAEMPTLGTPIEIEKALELGKPVVIVAPLATQDSSVVVASWVARGAVVTADWQQAAAWAEGILRVETDHVAGGEKRYERISVEGETYTSDDERQNEQKREVLVRGAERLQVGRVGDAGWDLVVSEGIKIAPGEFADVHCDVSIAWPEGYWGWIVGRSSTLRTRKLLINQGIIDQGWRGELMVGVWNMDRSHMTTIFAGERIAQVIPMHHVAAELEPVGWPGLEWRPGEGSLQEEWGQGETWGDRGEQGFGSSGR